MAVASLVLGIISLVFLFIVPIVGVIVGLVGIILGAMARKVPEKQGMATAGLVCSIIGVALGLVMFIACAGCAATGAGILSSMN